MRISVPLLALCLALPGALAIDPHPDANDAGTGGDAGDFAHEATPVSYGTHRGVLTTGIDAEDYYRLDATPGTTLVFNVTQVPCRGLAYLLDPEGIPLTVFSAKGVHRVPVHEAGWWTIRVSIAQSTQECRRLAYAFQLGSEALGSYLTQTSSREWHTLETRWSEAGRINAYADVRIASDAQDEPTGFMVLVEYRLRNASGAWPASNAFYLAGFRDVTPSRLEVVPSAAPGLDLPVAVTWGQSTRHGWLSITIEAPSSGELRLTAYTAREAASRSFFVVEHDTPVEKAWSEGDGVLSWANTDAESRVVSPVLIESGGGRYPLQIDRRFVGYFLARNPGDQAEDANGKRIGFNGGGSTYLLWLPAQEVFLRTSASSSMDPAGEHLHFHGAYVPSLGLVQIDPFDGSSG